MREKGGEGEREAGREVGREGERDGNSSERKSQNMNNFNFFKYYNIQTISNHTYALPFSNKCTHISSSYITVAIL